MVSALMKSISALSHEKTDTSKFVSNPPLSDHPHFQEWRDPVSGVVSYVLENKIAPIQRGMYFVVPSIRGKGNWLWFYAFRPPVKRPFLARVSLRSETPDLQLFPHVMPSGNPWIQADGQSIDVPIGDEIHRVGADGETSELFHFPDSLRGNRHLFNLCTELTPSCDGKYYLLDSRIGNRWLISLLDIQSGELSPLRWFGNSHHHAMFSKHDPNLFMVNQGHWTDPITGDKMEMNVRMWLMDTRLSRYEPVDGGLWFKQNSNCCHEWWTPSGKIQWCDYNEGIWEMDLRTRDKTLLWEHPLVHGQTDPSERFLVGDQNPYQWNESRPCSVWFFDRQSGKEIPIVSRMPPQPLPWRDFRTYHIDPHPHFSEDGRWIIYTTTAFGPVSVALCPVAQFIPPPEL